MDRKILRGAYARLRAIKGIVQSNLNYVMSVSVGRDYNDIVMRLEDATADADETTFSDFLLPNRAFVHDEGGGYLDKSEIQNKVEQLTHYLEYVFYVNDQIVEIGSIYNSINDDELKSRCSDLLTAPSNFDRVINQATLVLEERIRKIGKDTASLMGATLVNAYIKADPAKSVIVASRDKGEQEGFANIFRGVVGAFRNPSHHKFLEDVTREQALQVCAFIDNLLRLLGESDVFPDRK